MRFKDRLGSIRRLWLSPWGAPRAPKAAGDALSQQRELTRAAKRCLRAGRGLEGFSRAALIGAPLMAIWCVMGLVQLWGGAGAVSDIAGQACQGARCELALAARELSVSNARLQQVTYQFAAVALRLLPSSLGSGMRVGSVDWSLPEVESLAEPAPGPQRPVTRERAPSPVEAASAPLREAGAGAATALSSGLRIAGPFFGQFFCFIWLACLPAGARSISKELAVEARRRAMGHLRAANALRAPASAQSSRLALGSELPEGVRQGAKRL